MLLPTKGISPDRALLTIGSDLLIVLRRPTTVSALWDRFNSSKNKDGSGRITGSSRFLVNGSADRGVHAAVRAALASRIRAR